VTGVLAHASAPLRGGVRPALGSSPVGNFQADARDHDSSDKPELTDLLTPDPAEHAPARVERGDGRLMRTLCEQRQR
jgi:hypothetical protein